MGGLAEWLKSHNVKASVTDAVQKSKLWSEDVSRLTGIRKSANNNGWLGWRQARTHRLEDLELHHIKKDGQLKIYWPKNTPSANALDGTRGGKGKGGAENKYGHKGNPDGKQNAERQVRFGGTSKSAAVKKSCDICLKLGVPDTVHRNQCMLCGLDGGGDKQHAEDQDKELEGSQEEQNAEEVLSGTAAPASLAQKRKELAEREQMFTKFKVRYPPQDPLLLTMGLAISNLLKDIEQ